MPTRGDLLKAYEFLQSLGGSKAADLDPQHLILWGQWARLDARLAELVVRFLAKYFAVIDPFQMWRANNSSLLPQAFALLTEFAKLEVKNQKQSVKEFEVWCAAALYGLRAGPQQMFFLREGPMRPELDEREIQSSLKMYRKWGFFGSDRIVTLKDGSIQTTTFLNKEQRAAVLKSLLKNKKIISVEDYIEASGGKIHRRTAERDLAEEKNLKRSGFTRGRRYSRAP